MTHRLRRQPRRHGDRHEHLDGEDDRCDLGRRAALQRRHLGQQAEAGGRARRREPQQRLAGAPSVHRVDDELRREPAPRQRAARGHRHQRAAPDEEQADREDAQRAQHHRQLDAGAGFVRGRTGDGSDHDDAREDRERRAHVAATHPDPGVRAPIARSASSPNASDGCTTASGASPRASACSGQPRRLRPVPASQRGRRTSRSSSAGRRLSSAGASRASSACSASPTL